MCNKFRAKIACLRLKKLVIKSIILLMILYNNNISYDKIKVKIIHLRNYNLHFLGHKFDSII